MKLCQQLGYLPLCLQLVGRYLAEDPDLSLREMLQRLKAKESEDNELSNPQQAVLAAFELSWNELTSIIIRKNLDRCKPSSHENPKNSEPWSVTKVVASIKDFFRNF